MSEVQYVTFKVYGDWFTDFVRTRFWDEKCGLEEAIRIIQESLSADITEEMCIQILEGKKKFVGCNEFDFVDDNENIRPISLYIKQQEKELTINKIIRDIETYPYNYIDSYACTTSRAWFDHQFKYNYNETLQNGFWYNKLVYERGNEYDVLKNGCTWLEDYEYTAKVILKHTDKTSLNYYEFAEVVYKEYEEQIDKLRKKKIPFDELSDYHQSIICRNQHYVFFHKEINGWNYLGETNFNRLKYAENLRRQKEELKKREEAEKLLEEKKYGTAKQLANNPKMSEFNIMQILKHEDFDTTPININDIESGWDGFIDKEGNFYKTKPIGAGWYNGTANCHMEFAIQYLKEQGIKVDKDEKDYMINTMGWCDYGHYVLSGRGVAVQKPKKLTKEQEKTLFKLFELNKDDMTYYFNLLDKEY
jgi:hypothetical protein